MLKEEAIRGAGNWELGIGNWGMGGFVFVGWWWWWHAVAVCADFCTVQSTEGRPLQCSTYSVVPTPTNT